MPAACRGLRRTAPTRDWRSRGGSGGAVALLVEHAGCALAHGCLLASLEKGVVGLGRQVGAPPPLPLLLFSLPLTLLYSPPPTLLPTTHPTIRQAGEAKVYLQANRVRGRVPLWWPGAARPGSYIDLLTEREDA
jgi:hypothetical protein